MTEQEKSCKNCFHMVRYIGKKDKGWCGNYNSPRDDQDVDMNDYCEEWNKREPFVW